MVTDRFGRRTQSSMHMANPLSAVDSKPATKGRIKTSHFFRLKPGADVLARNDLTFSDDPAVGDVVAAVFALDA
jgi:hypothetical protein